MNPRRIVTILLLTILLALLARWRVSRLFYYPDHVSYGTPADLGLTYEEVTFPSRDGTRLTGWFVPAVGPAHGTVIHFHGNAQNMSAHFGFVDWLPAAGFNLFVFDYRGYGKSAGRPDRCGLYEDSLAAIDYVRGRKDLDRNRLVVLGQSLGGAQAIVAVGGGDRSGIRGVAVESTFFSYREIVRDKIGDIPLLSLLKTPLARLLLDDDLSPADAVGKIAPIPILLIYGTADPVIPYAHGTRLFAMAREPKQFWTIDGGDHTEAFAETDSPHRLRLIAFFREVLGVHKGD